MFAGGPLAGALFDRYGPRWILLVGSFLHVFGLFMTSISSKYYQYLLSQGALLPPMYRRKHLLIIRRSLQPNRREFHLLCGYEQCWHMVFKEQSSCIWHYGLGLQSGWSDISHHGPTRD